MGSNKIIFSFIISFIFLVSFISATEFGYNTIEDPNSLYGEIKFDGGWESGGCTITDGDIYCQEGYFYNISSLNVTQQNLTIIDYLNVDGELAVEGTGDSYIMGNLGIGITNPLYELDIDGTINADDYTMNFASGIETVMAPFLDVLAIGGGGNEIVLFSDGGISSIYIDDVGQVGIGTDEPLEQFDVVGDSLFEGNITMEGMEMLVGEGGAVYPEDWSGGTIVSVSPSAEEDAGITMGGIFSAFQLWFENGGDDGYIDILGDSDNSDIFFRTRVEGTPINAMTIKGSGNVGIGTTSPQRELHVNGDILSNATINATTDVCIEGGNCLSDMSSTGGTLTGTGTLGYVPMWNGTSSLNNSGIYMNGSNVGIGTSSPNAPLQVDSTSSTTIRALNTATSSANSGGGLFLLEDDGAAMGSSHRLGIISFGGAEDSSNTIHNAASITGVTTEVWNSASNGARLAFQTTANGATSRTERMTIDEDGNVGIGTTSPSSILHVQSGAVANKHLDLSSSRVGIFEKRDITVQIIATDGGNNAGALVLTNAPSSGDNKHWVVHHRGVSSSDRLSFQYGTTASSGLDLRDTGNTDELMVITTDGNVGIGITSPGQKLHVYDGGFLVNNSGNASLFFVDNVTGNVGIGTTSPTALLELGDGSGSPDITLNKSNDGTASIYFNREGTNDWYLREETNEGLYLVGERENENLKFRTNSGGMYFSVDSDVTTIMTLADTNNVGIGTTSPDTKLQIDGNFTSETDSTDSIGTSLIQWLNGFFVNLFVSGDLEVGGDLNVTGNLSVKNPYGMFSSNESQIVAVAGTAYIMNFSHIEDDYMMELEGNENITIQDSGDYLITLSGLFVTDTNNKHFNIWLQSTHGDGVTFANVPRSNTRIEIENAGTDGLISVSFIIDLKENEKFRVMYSSDDAGSMTVWTAGHGAGADAVPETPSMIMTLSKISEITD